MKYIVIAYVVDEDKVDPEQFGTWIKSQRDKYKDLLKTDKISILVI